MMSSEMLSLLVRCWHDVQADATQLQVVRVDTGEEIHLNDGTFLLRISSDADQSALRCLIRHLASGREAYIQSGQGMQSFVKACLLSESTPPGEPGEDEHSQDSSKNT